MDPKFNGVLGVEVGVNSIRMIQYDRSQQVVDLVAINPIEPKDVSNMAAIEEEMQSILDNSNARARDVVVSVPGQNILVKRFRLDADENDIRQALEWEIGQQLLGSIDEFRIDFQEMVPEADLAGQKEYLVVACRSEYVDRIVRVLHRLKLNPVLVDVDLFALQNAFEANYPEEIDKVCLVLFCEGVRTQMLLCKGGQILDYDIVISPSPAQEQGTGQWVSDQIRTFLALPFNQEHSPIGGIWLGGEVAKDDAFVKGLQGGITGSEVHLLSPFNQIRIRDDLAEQMVQHMPLCSVAVGLVLRGMG